MICGWAGSSLVPDRGDAVMGISAERSANDVKTTITNTIFIKMNMLLSIFIIYPCVIHFQ